jgi:hypothetical protein
MLSAGQSASGIGLLVSLVESSVVDGGGAIKHRVGSHWVMVSKRLGLVGAGVVDMMGDGRRRSM